MLAANSRKQGLCVTEKNNHSDSSSTFYFLSVFLDDVLLLL